MFQIDSSHAFEISSVKECLQVDISTDRWTNRWTAACHNKPLFSKARAQDQMEQHQWSSNNCPRWNPAGHLQRDTTGRWYTIAVVIFQHPAHYKVRIINQRELLPQNESHPYALQNLKITWFHPNQIRNAIDPCLNKALVTLMLSDSQTGTHR